MNQVSSENNRNWHALATTAAFEAFASSANGITQSEAERRLARYGLNQLVVAKPRSPLVRFLTQFHNVLIYVLVGAALVTAALAHWVDTGVIVGVVLINGLIGFIQEGKAERPWTPSATCCLTRRPCAAMADS